ncbi:hypothetical protein [Vibrio europaeus]|uniref:Uncharacterized protein n=1 Tax=Vibrio europaeus TaxID=300876 RepID=A0A178J3U8_9VIBR|nr:hypothetical protein [Vibrio europaeus]MDC5706488.1 hypothetical protein [Vibrio europaeus]MDC5711979.1 hypothetical protein [Vibrio europaeus]MDC5716328.1 hypothetical protein [Vibrio europaeus]MDC5725899.1 hypothetical protein [Vibrio europaeus]MDC5732888.1 hypothetical protein [Vibrio europaeus]
MFNEGEGLNSEVKFVVASAYDAFSKTWGELPSSRLNWIDLWSDHLKEIPAATIKQAVEHCVRELSDCPSLPVFRKYCKRVDENESLSEPMVSIEEKIAKAILNTPKEQFGYQNLDEFADALLIAALVISAKNHESVGLKWRNELVESEFKSRAGLFGTESVIWNNEAHKGQGYWSDILGNIDND